MKRYHTLLTYWLALLMTVQAFVMPVVYLDFKLQQDYIAKVLCINRDKPQTHCNGQCILMQRLKKTQEQESSTTHQVKEILWIGHVTVPEPVYPLFLSVQTTYGLQAPPLYCFQSTCSIFHPPRQA